MKGKTNVGVVISETETLAAGTEVEIVDVRYGCETYYICIIPSGAQIPIDARIVDITDHTSYIDWEQRRYELVKVITHGLSCAPVVKGVDPNPTPDDFAYMVVRNADAIIKKLKGE